MKVIEGTTTAAPQRPVDWDADDCLCQGEIPEEKKVYVQQHVYSEKLKKKRWRNALRFHIDCPIHGVTITTEDRPCREA